MPASLLDLQRRFRSALLSGENAALPEIRGAGLAPAERLAIYRNNMIGNLAAVLRLTYPAIERLVGSEFFAAGAACFIAATPPNSADLYEYGETFADILAHFEQTRHIAYLADVARLEWAVNRALHAPLVPALTRQAIRAVPVERQADLRFVAHPSLSILSLPRPARAIWQAVMTDDPELRRARFAGIDFAAGPEDLAVLHGRESLEVMPLSAPMFRLADALLGGVPLVEALALVPPEEAALLLGGLLAHGFFSRCFPLAAAAPGGAEACHG